MTNAFSTAYPSDHSIAGRVFGPVIDPWAYLRALHLAIMFPLGVAYFVFFVTAFSFGGSLVWTFVGPPVLLVAMWVSLRLADGEAWVVSHVAGVEIRRPPQRLEGVTSFRQRLWARAIDPTTWTGLLYEILQFPLGLATFVTMVVMFTVSGAFIGAPLIIMATGEPLQIGSDNETKLITQSEDGPIEIVIDNGTTWWEITRPYEALPLTAAGLALWLLTIHAALSLSSLHAMWAQLMLGSKSKRRPAALDPDRPAPSPEPPQPRALPPPPVEIGPSLVTALSNPQQTIVPFKPAETPPAAEAPPESSVDDPPELAELTPREREVTLLLARGMSNADIADACFISEGTVKTHVKRILSKLDLHDRTQVVVFAYERGLVAPGRAAGQADADGFGMRSPVP